MNISSTFSSILGTLEKGLFFKLAHNPLSIKISLIFSLFASKPERLSINNISSSLLLFSITNDSKALLSPLFISMTSPEIGATKNKPGIFLSSNNFCPFFTWSPTFINIVGFKS